MLRYLLLCLVLVALLKRTSTSSYPHYDILKGDLAFEEAQKKVKKPVPPKKVAELALPPIPADATANSDNFVNSAGFNNNNGETLNFECGSYSALNSIKSLHSKKKDDRQFAFACSQVTSSDTPFVSCYWTDFVNHWTRITSFTCKANFVIAGVHSIYNSKSKDRRWKFQCCHSKDYVTEACGSTEYLNGFGAPFYFYSGKRVFIGVHSYYRRRGLGDRRYKITHCAYAKH